MKIIKEKLMFASILNRLRNFVTKYLTNFSDYDLIAFINRNDKDHDSKLS